MKLNHLWLDKLKMNKNQWIVVILIGVLLLVIALPTDTANKRKSNTISTEDTDEADLASSEYEQKLEKRLESILEKVDGVENVEVMITLKDSGESKLYEAKETMPEVEGVLIVVQGAKDTQVETEIYESVLALFPVEAHKIKIVKMGNQEE